MKQLIFYLIIFNSLIVHAEENDSGDFFSHFEKSLIKKLYQAACINPKTGERDKDSYEKQLSIHKNYSQWLDKMGGRIHRSKLKTNEDKTMAQKYNQVMANKEFLDYDFDVQIKYIKSLKKYLSECIKKQKAIFNSLSKDPKLKAFYQDRLKEKLTVTFYRIPSQTTAAVYIPGQKVIVINLRAIHNNRAFLDSLEHELCHHFLPNRKNFMDNLNYEGFIEIFSEFYSDKIHQHCQLDKLKDSSIQYPIQSTYAALLFYLNPELTQKMLSAQIDLKTYTDQLPKSAFEKEMSKSFLNFNQINDSEKHSISKTLSWWNWTEKDGSSLSLDKYLDENVLKTEAVKKLFRTQKKFLSDFVDARIIQILKQLIKVHSKEEILKHYKDKMPAYLLTHTKSVFNYLDDDTMGRYKND